MAKELVSKRSKFDPNTEAFQMRAQWKKVDNCRKQWNERWNWLLSERKQAIEEANAIRSRATDSLSCDVLNLITKKPLKALKPMPTTSTGFIGWLSTRPDCQLEIYTPWLNKVPIKVPDPWEAKDYVGVPETSE